MQLGIYIRKKREEKDLSLREFASQLKKSPAFISDIELGRRNPGVDLLNEIAQFFEVPVSELQKYDARVPVDAMKQLVQQNPGMSAMLGVALRKAAEKKLTPTDIEKLIDQIDKNKGR